ncbi:SDR family NAD(P)-dependent oxidoreductase [Amycolatopsis pithecellobii]|uniref:SDR family oxidoreductase n=1 Tax=Amycolatopsis pithecellobii TaxID=664692 RepID=A0A6N7ZAY7_9PSEU|nr:SDR family NAD(P)-dependent oxidoreductase [Amycolatopsis pithecellobii]MTD58903.1 SDR family oxidoreductase [Amycolatopsis pithecellobii]
MAGRLAGKVAVITGTGRGMARQVALRFVREGASVVGCDIDAEAAQETLEIVRAAGGRMESLHPLDLFDEKEAHRLLEFAAEQFGGVDIVDNNAMQLRLGPVEDMSLADWQLTIDNTLTVPFLVSKHAIPHLRARGGGSIIFMGSAVAAPIGAGYAGNLPLLPAYAVAKAGVLRLTVALANELAPWKIRVNAISPGCVATPNGLSFYGQEGSEPRRVVESALLIPEMTAPEDIADAMVFLASPEASFVTGHNLAVDGGYVASGAAGPQRPEDVAAYAPIMAELAVVDHWPTTGVRPA